MRRLLQTTFFSMGILLILTTALLHTQRDGEGVPSFYVEEGWDKRRVLQMNPLNHQSSPVTPMMNSLHYRGTTPHGLIFVAAIGPEDYALYLLPNRDAPPQILAAHILSRLTLSENGEWAIVSDSGGLAGNYGLRAVRTDGGGSYPLTLELREDLEIYADMNPIIAPDGTWMAFAVYTPEGEIDAYLVSTDGTGLENLTPEVTGTFAYPIAWTDTGLILAYGTRVYRVEDNTPVPLVVEPQNADVRETWLAHIPDIEAELVMSGNPATVEITLMAVHADGRVAWQQPITPISPTTPPYYSILSSSAWVVSTQDDHWVRIRTVDGAVFPIQSPLDDIRMSNSIWSADGSMALIVGTRAIGSEVWVLDVATDDLTLLLDTADQVASAFWTPDGQHVLLIINRTETRYLAWLEIGRPGIRWQHDIGWYDGFVGWGPTIQKEWSVGLLLAIGVVCVTIGAVRRSLRRAIQPYTRFA
ncbi:MAG: hypothetical protein K8L91_00225 [Anaerolineae bacterium]|nr:hypothetical protein [Anaerolineae bacterium]